MKYPLKTVLLALAIFFGAGFMLQAQAQEPSIEDQIRQKEAELERLKEIKKRQDRIRTLQEEIRRLQGGENIPDAVDRSQPGGPSSSPQPTDDANSETSPVTNPVSNANDTIPASPLSISRAFVPLTTNDKSDLPTLRNCADVQRISSEAVGANRTNPTSLFERTVCRTIRRIERAKATNAAAKLDLRTDFYPLMIVLLAREGRAEYVLAAEEESVDTQVGSDASSAGSTSLTTKGSVPGILGFAVDSGGLLKSIDGSTLTFRGNVTGLAKALGGKGFISGFDEDSPAARFFRRTAFSFSFDTGRGNQPGTFVGSRQQLSNYGFHLDLYNKRDPREPRYRDDWKAFLSTVSEDFVTQIQSSLIALADPSANRWHDPSLQAWYVLMDSAIENASAQEVESVFKQELTRAPADMSPTVVTELRSFNTRFREWIDAREGILRKIAKAPILSFEYVNDRPANNATLSKFNVIGEFGFGPKLDLTFNGALTMFNSRPTLNVKRVRDFQFATQLDVPFGEMGMGLGKPVLSFAGRWERLLSDATSPAGIVVPDTEGDIAIGQVKFTIPIKKSGVRIPLSFSFANRTELIKEREVRGNFGFTFDLDKIFANFKPF